MIPPSPFCVTTTPNCFKLAFPYHPRLVELVKRIPSVKQNIRAAYIADEKAWKVSLQDKEYVRMMADWAVQTKICSRVQHKVTTREYNTAVPILRNYYPQLLQISLPISSKISGASQTDSKCKTEYPGSLYR